ncbi:MASE1 domain-containing protein [Streptomyces sp. NPDC127084]|uniref:MASE1 domain-containing protein n=1 Tax=Streptomyces sp. NPDC127084 TaxID=3347133 RepID=UPI003654295D
MRKQEVRGYGIAMLWILAVAAVYYGAAQLGLLLQLVRGQVTPLWPPTGLALAALLLLGSRVWPGIALGAFLTNVSIGPTPLAVLVIVAGNTLAPVVAYLLLRRAGFRSELDRLRDGLLLVFLGALAGMLISSTVGSSVLMISGAVAPGAFWPTWSVWWTGDAMGVLVVTPFLLVLRRLRWPPDARAARWVEAVALTLFAVAATVLATQSRSSSLLFLVFPALIWAAFRFQLAGAAPCALGVSIMAILAATWHTGPFVDQDLFASMVTLQAFNGSTALVGLLLSAVIAERNETHEEIKRVCERLEEMVANIEPGNPGDYGDYGNPDDQRF